MTGFIFYIFFILYKCSLRLLNCIQIHKKYGKNHNNKTYPTEAIIQKYRAELIREDVKSK